MVHGEGPEGSPGAGGCPGRAGKGREGSRVLSNAATDVLHEGPEAQGGGLGTRRLAAGEGLPGGRHRLGEHANSSSCLAPSGLRFCGDPPTILRARSASYASEACLGASEDASRPRARVRFECQFEFPSSFWCMRRRELSRAAMTIHEKSRRRPHALEDTPHDAGSDAPGRAHGGGFETDAPFGPAPTKIVGGPRGLLVWPADLPDVARRHSTPWRVALGPVGSQRRQRRAQRCAPTRSCRDNRSWRPRSSCCV